MSMYTLSPDLGLLGLLLPLLLSDVLLCPLLGGPPLASWLATLWSFLWKSVLIIHIFDYYMHSCMSHKRGMGAVLGIAPSLPFPVYRSTLE